MCDAGRRLDPDEVPGVQASRREALGEGPRGHASREQAERSEPLGSPAQIRHPHPST